MAEIKITADASQAFSEVRDLKAAMSDLDKATSAAAATFAKITAAAAAVGYAISRTIDSVSDLKDMSKALGMSAQNLQYLQQSAAMAGIGADELNSALVRLQNNIGTALIQQTGPAYDAMKRMGMSFTELKALSPEQQFTTIAQKIAAIPDPAQRAAMAVDLLGKQGPRLLAAALAMEEIKKRTEELGLALSDLDVEMIDQAGDSMDRLKGVVTAGVQKAVANLSPYIITLTQYIEAAVASIVKNKDAWMDVLKALGLVIGALVTFRIYMVMTAIITSILAAASAMVRMYEAIKLATTAMEVLNAVMGKNPIIKILSLVLALGSMFVATKAVGSAFSKWDEDAKKLTDDINQGMAENTAGVKGVGTAVDETSDKIMKARETAKKGLEDAIRNASVEWEYASDLVKFGQKQADINKVINEQKRKLADVGLEMSKADEAAIRSAMNKTQILKEQAEILKTQFNLMGDLFNSKTSAEKVTAEIQNIRNTIEGNSIVIPIKFETPEELANIDRDAALKLLQKRVDDTAKAEISKYDRILAIKVEKERALADIDEQIKQVKIAFGEEELIRTQALEDAKTVIKANARASELQAEIDLINEKDKIKNLELERDRLRMVEKLKMEKDLLGGRLYTDQQADDIAKKTAENKKAYEQNATKFVIDQGANALAALGTQNKKAFEAYKAFKIAQILMDTYAGARAAFASLAPIPFVGVPLGIAAAAAAVAAGMAQIAQVRGLQYSGRALGGPVMGGKPYLVGENGPELFTPNTTGSITRNSDLQSGGTTNINFTIVANDTTGFDQLLTSRRGVIQQIISDAMLEKGQRSMV